MSRRRRQRGAALLIFATVVVLGVAWYAVAALGKAPVARAEREIKTGLALQEAKRALLAYVAQYAARPATTEPGQMPCPESPTLANPGQSSSSCSATAIEVGRLPWKTLGIDQLSDGEGEPLWYMMRGFRDSPINFGTAGQLIYNGAPVVAIIIAPGRPQNTAAVAGTPSAGCTKQNQMVAARNSASLDAANFIECGLGTGSVTIPGDATWTNDRVIAISPEEWADAIAGPVADRMQRQVAVALRTWDATELDATGKSWGVTHSLPYLPFASTWGNPTSNDFCGDQGELGGLMPIDPSCYDEKWSVVAVNPGGGIEVVGGGSGCTDMGTFLRCSLRRTLGLGSVSAEIILRADNVARTFRGTLQLSEIQVSNGGSKSMSMALSNSTADATLTVDANWAGLLSLFQQVSVDIPHLQSAQVFADPGLTWFWNNQWQRYAYYGVSAGAVASPTMANRCNAAGDPGCLTVNNLAAASGSTNDKRLVLVLSGTPLAGKSQPSPNLDDYFENQNASTGAVYEAGAAGGAFNDRIAACPFQYTPATGPVLTVCN
jgi:hypothetical protein